MVFGIINITLEIVMESIPFQSIIGKTLSHTKCTYYICTETVYCKSKYTCVSLKQQGEEKGRIQKQTVLQQ